MARLEREPWPGFSLSGGDIHAEIKAQEALLKEIEAKHTIARFPVADGYALYAVMSESPLVLKHIPFCDAYQAAAATIRGFNLADLERQRGWDSFMKKGQDEAEAFYESLKPGQVVHYNHAFGEWLRCEVVVKDGRNELLPKALVGEWRPYDLPRRQPDGSVHWGYQVEKIREGKAIRPHATSIWENPKCANRGRLKDPTGMAEVDLSVPEMSAEEQERARLWRAVDAIRAAVSVPQDGDPLDVLARVERLVKAA